MCLCVLFARYCVLFYGVFCSWCLCVCYVFAWCACGVLCYSVWFGLIVFVCVGVLLMCLCGVFMVYCVRSYGVFLFV